MANRIVSDITWKSRKIRQVREEFRAEYTWLLPLFNEWGAAELDPESIWHSAYALNRPSWTMDKVALVCAALVEAGLWAVWQQNGHTYAYLVGSHKPGLLPKPSDRNLKGLRPPADLLARFVGGDSAPELPTSSQTPANGYGYGLGNGSGMGTGSGIGDGHGDGTGASLKDRDADTHGTTKADPNPTPVNQGIDTSMSKTKLGKPPRLPYGFPNSTANGVVHYLRNWVVLNPKATDTPANWETLWTPDVETLIRKYGVEGTCKMIEFSQTSKYAEYIFRGKTLVDYAPELAQKMKLETRREEPGIDDI